MIRVTRQQARILDALKARKGLRLSGIELARAAGITKRETLAVQIYNLREALGPALELESELYGPDRGYLFHGVTVPYAIRERSACSRD